MTKESTRIHEASSASAHARAPSLSSKSFMTTAMLSLFLGMLGVDRFYLNYRLLGLLKLISFGGFGVWYLIDVIRILSGSLNDSNGHALVNRKGNMKLAVAITCVVFALGLLVSLASNNTTTTSVHVKSSTVQPLVKPKTSLSKINPQAAKILTTATNQESQLMDTVQSEASQPNAATYNSAFTTRWRDVKSSTVSVMAIQTATNDAGNLYYNANQTAPDAVDNWSYDCGVVDGDIVSWINDQEQVNADQATGNDASADQAKVSTDYQKYKNDLAQTETDINQL